MNRKKIEKALEQITKALECIDYKNFPEFSMEDLDFEGEKHQVSNRKVYNDTSKAYQLLDGISYELTSLLEE